MARAPEYCLRELELLLNALHVHFIFQMLDLQYLANLPPDSV